MRKLLFFTYDFPYPTTSGGKSRAFHMLKFGREGFDITLFSFIRSDFKPEYKLQLEKNGITDVYLFDRKPVKSLGNLKSVIHPRASIFNSLYYDSEVEKKLIEIVKEKNIEIAHFESLYTAYYIGKNLKDIGVTQIFGTENIEYKNYQEYIRKFPGILHIPFSHQVKKIQQEEEKFARNSDITLTVTQEEADFFKGRGASRVEIIPNGVDIEVFKYKPSTRPEGQNILFVGNFSYFPNRDAIAFFYHDVFQKLQGDYNLKLIGKGVHSLGISHSRVTLTEYVDDIRDEYYKADVLASPIRIGGGTNFKVLEAMACGLPVIMHSSRVQSLDLTPDENVIASDEPEEFAKKLEMLLMNDGLQGKLAKAAREHIEKNYSWQVIGKKLNTVWQSLLFTK